LAGTIATGRHAIRTSGSSFAEQDLVTVVASERLSIPAPVVALP
jgi:hypothetical protein